VCGSHPCVIAPAHRGLSFRYPGQPPIVSTGNLGSRAGTQQSSGPGCRPGATWKVNHYYRFTTYIVAGWERKIRRRRHHFRCSTL
jgi:hypothetical protein